MKISLTLLLLVWVSLSLAQNLKNAELKDRPGTFEILSRTDYTSADCGFTKADVTANMQRIVNLVNTVRKNPVLSDIKGFDGRARIYNVLCKEKCGYGVPARISFEFSSFFYSKTGKVVCNTIEPPEWSLFINKVFPLDAGFNSYLFNREKCYFTVPLNKKTIQPGIDIYDNECVVLYDPSMPDYWIPVTVGEAYATAKESNLENEKDPVAKAYLQQFLDKEYSEFDKADFNEPAYFGGGISRVTASPGMEGQDSLFPRIMTVNPAYWNKNLSRSAIQFITLRSVQNKTYLKNEYNDCLKHLDSGSGCDLAKFELSYSIEDIRRLLPLIGK
jgi:hypothetical protein